MGAACLSNSTSRCLSGVSSPQCLCQRQLIRASVLSAATPPPTMARTPKTRRSAVIPLPLNSELRVRRSRPSVHEFRSIATTCVLVAPILMTSEEHEASVHSPAQQKDDQASTQQHEPKDDEEPTSPLGRRLAAARATRSRRVGGRRPTGPSEQDRARDRRLRYSAAREYQGPTLTSWRCSSRLGRRHAGR